MFQFSSTKNLAIDLGNNNTLLTDQSALLFSQPSYMVVNEHNNKVEAVGDLAYSMWEKMHSNLKPIKPLKGGVISDGESAKKMLKEMIGKIQKPSLFPSGFNYLISGVPYDTTPVEKRALRDALDQFSSRNTHLVYEPLAAALGLGLNIQKPEGKLVVDMGGGITEVVIISLSGIAAFQSTRTAGDTLDEEIQDYFRRTYNFSVGIKTAEQMKKEIGCVFSYVANEEEFFIAKGKDLMEGIPVSRKVSQAELTSVLEKPFQKIEECIRQSLQICPPELASDIYRSGIYVTGGNAKLKGIKERLSKTFQLPVHIDPQPLLSVSKGISQILGAPQKHRSVLV
ncbi:MAG: rod shape-determining protein [Cyclobacteriaceae bacterium]|nr:rod shape-determining protein [Cyclobacteriaceae bacterium]